MMEDLIRLAEAMGFWGWIAVIACTAIISEAFVKIKKMQFKSEMRQLRQELPPSEQSGKARDPDAAQVDSGRDGVHFNDGTEQVSISKDGITVRDGEERVDINWSGMHVKDAEAKVHISFWLPACIVSGIILVPLFILAVIF